MPVTFRKATADDVPLVASIIDAAYGHYIPIFGGRKPRPMTDDHAARIERGETFVVEDATGPVGITSMHVEGGRVHIFNIAVHPDAQGRGLLHEVFDFSEAMARDSGATRLTLFTNALMERNRQIYAHVGFREVREEDAPGGYRIVFFERDVDA
jgi:N-acetylglutamate synthase-like GNAT family acetyltransferase